MTLSHKYCFHFDVGRRVKLNITKYFREKRKRRSVKNKKIIMTAFVYCPLEQYSHRHYT